jgi:hypothetical protein
MLDAVMIRTHAHSTLTEFAANSRVPVINGLSDESHPCQLLADMQTFLEHRGSIQGKTVAWIGDGFNMCNSYIEAARQFDFQLRIACPEGYEPDQRFMALGGDRVQIIRDPRKPCAAHTWWSPMSGLPWARKRKLHGAWRISRLTRSPANCSTWRHPMSCSCTACPPTVARKSARTCSTTHVRSPGTRLKTACMHRRRFSNSL